MSPEEAPPIFIVRVLQDKKSVLRRKSSPLLISTVGSELRETTVRQWTLGVGLAGAQPNYFFKSRMMSTSAEIQNITDKNWDYVNAFLKPIVVHIIISMYNVTR